MGKYVSVQRYNVWLLLLRNVCSVYGNELGYTTCCVFIFMFFFVPVKTVLFSFGVCYMRYESSSQILCGVYVN